LAAEIEATRQRVLAAKASGDAVLGDVAEMRDRIASAKAPDGPFDAKIGAGRLQDVELAGQMVALRAGSFARTTQDQIDAGVMAGMVSAADGAALQAAADMCWTVQVAAQLVIGGGLDADRLGEGERRLLARETGTPDLDGLAQHMDEVCGTAARAIARLVGETDGKG